MAAALLLSDTADTVETEAVLVGDAAVKAAIVAVLASTRALIGSASALDIIFFRCLFRVEGDVSPPFPSAGFRFLFAAIQATSSSRCSLGSFLKS